jgi:hypothetical protein
MSMILICVVAMIPLSGCIENLDGCGDGYSEMYGGYDYIYSTKDVNQNNSINVTIELLKQGGGWLEDIDEYPWESKSVWVTLSIKMTDGTVESISEGDTYWEISGDSSNGSYWSTNLYYQSPAGFCDNGCEQVSFSASVEGGSIYYDGTCDSSPWIDI